MSRATSGIANLSPLLSACTAYLAVIAFLAASLLGTPTLEFPRTPRTTSALHGGSPICPQAPNDFFSAFLASLRFHCLSLSLAGFRSSPHGPPPRPHAPLPAVASEKPGRSTPWSPAVPLFFTISAQLPPHFYALALHNRHRTSHLRIPAPRHGAILLPIKPVEQASSLHLTSLRRPPERRVYAAESPRTRGTAVFPSLSARCRVNAAPRSRRRHRRNAPERNQIK